MGADSIWDLPLGADVTYDPLQVFAGATGGSYIGDIGFGDIPVGGGMDMSSYVDPLWGAPDFGGLTGAWGPQTLDQYGNPVYVVNATGQMPNSNIGPQRSEERRVGKECRSRWSPAP